jgi:hypothetical protein
MAEQPAFPTCILCLKEPAESREHIIPRFIGGRLSFHTPVPQVQQRARDEACLHLAGGPLYSARS